MRIVKIFLRAVIFTVLTVVTQIGGLVYLLNLLFFKLFREKFNSKLYFLTARLASFIFLYLFFTLVLVPRVAPLFGRVPLPMTTVEHVKPLNKLTYFLNRNYVRPQVRTALFSIGRKMHQQFSGTEINYLDANFPFINKFPLIPHLSHNDGKKLDLAFCYIDEKNGEINTSPSFIGYGICEEPARGEENKAEFCADKGYWQYSFLKVVIPQAGKKDFKFDQNRTKALVSYLIREDAVSKIFIEPHLKKRLALSSEKIRFHGCQAVRHDDHIHFQVK